MADPYIGEIRIFGFPFAPSSYMACNGQLLPISQYEALYAIIGTTYGGNGTSNFQLPNLANNAAMHWGNGPGLTPRVLGETDGAQNVTLTSQQIPQHTHLVTTADTTVTAQKIGAPSASAYIGPANPANPYIPTGTPNVNLSPKMVSTAGSSLPHNNIQPVLALNYCIAVYGAFPSRN